MPEKTTSVRIRGAALALSIAFGSVGFACSTQRSVKDENVSGTISSAQCMPDGKQWTTDNLKVDTAGHLVLRRRGTELPPIWACRLKWPEGR